MRVQKATFLFENKEVERWYKNLAQGSVITADVYLRRLSRFCEETGLSPKEIVDLGEKEITDLLQDYVSEHSEKYAGSYLVSIIKIVRSWLTHNGKEIKRKVKVRGAEQSPTLRKEKIPTQEELKKILGSATIQSRVTCSLIAFSGLRPESIGNYEGEDGLAIEDLPELEIKKASIDFNKIPTLVTVRPELSKTKKQYFTFLGAEGCNYLKEYLESRLRVGEKLNSKSPVITAKVSRIRPFVSTGNIGDQVRKAIRLSGMDQRPYVLRSYFDTQLMMAESKGLIMRDYRTFMMGHVGDIEHRYTLNKNKLPEKTIEDMRESYSRALKFLETEQKGIPESEVNENIRALIKVMLLGAGYTKEEIEKGDMLSLPYEELAKRIGEKKALSQNNGHKQKVILARELRHYIEDLGWEYVKDLGDKEAIVKLPDRL